MQRLAGMVLIGNVAGQTHLAGVIRRTHELGLELVSCCPEDGGRPRGSWR
jgi:hypothetical protein